MGNWKKGYKKYCEKQNEIPLEEIKRNKIELEAGRKYYSGFGKDACCSILEEIQKNNEKLTEKLNSIKEKVIIGKLRILGINFDFKEESKKRFKSLVVVSSRKDNKFFETYYFNNGSFDGLKLVTFIIETNTNLSGGGVDSSITITYK